MWQHPARYTRVQLYTRHVVLLKVCRSMTWIGTLEEAEFLSFSCRLRFQFALPAHLLSGDGSSQGGGRAGDVDGLVPSRGRYPCPHAPLPG